MRCQLPRSPRRLRLVALTVTAIAAGIAASSSPAAAAEPELRWERPLGGKVLESSPLAVDLDGDGQKEVVVGAHDARVHALRAGDGSDAPGWPQPVTDWVNSSASAADVDGDGRPELFIGSGTSAAPTGALYSFAQDGRVRFRVSPDDHHTASKAVHSTPAIGDVRAGGSIDVSVASLGLRSIWSLGTDGVMNPGFPMIADDSIFSSPAVADVGGDGSLDVIVGGDSTPGGPVDHLGGLVRAVAGDGRLLWEHRVNDMVRSSPSVGDIDGDGVPEVVFGTGDFWSGSDSVKVFAVGLHDGALRPGWPQTTDGSTYGSPALADVDGNGTLDVLMGTFDGPLGDGGSVYAWDGRGGALPHFPRPSGGGVVIGSIVTADFDADGAQDPLVPTGGGVYAYSGRTGLRLFALLEGQASFQGSPVVTDLDADGRLDVVVAGYRPDGAGSVWRFELADGARLGEDGWHQFRKDDRRTGSWTTPPPVVARDTEGACPSGGVPEDGFHDVPQGSTHEAAIDCVVHWGLAQGSGGSYLPVQPVSREQMASFIARLVLRSGGTLPAGSNAFDDDAGSVHEASIDALAAAGIVSGTGPRRYAPGALVTRAQMATFLVRALEYRVGATLPAGPDHFFDDAGSVHVTNIDKAAEAGIASGYAGGSYRPSGNVGRDQMASFLARALDKLVDDGVATRPT